MMHQNAGHPPAQRRRHRALLHGVVGLGREVDDVPHLDRAADSRDAGQIPLPRRLIDPGIRDKLPTREHDSAGLAIA